MIYNHVAARRNLSFGSAADRRRTIGISVMVESG